MWSSNRWAIANRCLFFHELASRVISRSMLDICTNRPLSIGMRNRLAFCLFHEEGCRLSRLRKNELNASLTVITCARTLSLTADHAFIDGLQLFPSKAEWQRRSSHAASSATWAVGRWHAIELAPFFFRQLDSNFLMPTGRVPSLLISHICASFMPKKTLPE